MLTAYSKEWDTTMVGRWCTRLEANDRRVIREVYAPGDSAVSLGSLPDVVPTFHAHDGVRWIELLFWNDEARDAFVAHYASYRACPTLRQAEEALGGRKP